MASQEADAKTIDVLSKPGISTATFGKYKARHGGREVTDAGKLNTVEEENATLNKFLAGACLHNAFPKDVASRNGDAQRQTECGSSLLCAALSETQTERRCALVFAASK